MFDDVIWHTFHFIVFVGKPGGKAGGNAVGNADGNAGGNAPRSREFKLGGK